MLLMNFTHKSLAFTLAEVLITLGIIGIVTILALPILNNAFQDQQYAPSAKKAFSELSNATNLVLNNYGGDLSNVFSASNIVDIYAANMKIVKKCSNASTEGCWPASYTNGPSTLQTVNPGMILTDGTMIIFNLSTAPYSYDCNGQSGNAVGVCGDIYVDTNGAKPPNASGKDILAFVLYKDRLRLGGTNQDYYDLHASYYACQTGTNPFLCQLSYFK